MRARTMRSSCLKESVAGCSARMCFHMAATISLVLTAAATACMWHHSNSQHELHWRFEPPNAQSVTSFGDSSTTSTVAL